MPSKNTAKIYAPNAYYHIYNRGVEKRSIFIDNEDYAVFLNLLKRYLSNEPARDKNGREYPWLHKDLQLLAFCLMPNHFHLLIYQQEPNTMTKLLQGVATSYTIYFNKKYKRVGHLFQGRFKASMITTDSYLQHISRYIHLNPKDYLNWEFSSLDYYIGNKNAEWMAPKLILDIIPRSEYIGFLKDYEDHKQMLDEIKYELADR